MKKFFSAALLFTVIFSSAARLQAQGVFGNLGFEQATIVLVGGGAPPTHYSSASAFPGWTAYIDNTPVNWAFYNSVALGSAALSIHDTASMQPLAGAYSVFLQGTAGGPPSSASIAQTGTVPIGTQSLLFRAWSWDNKFQVAINNQALSLVALSSDGSSTLYGADISAFAGSANELKFTALPTGTLFLDSVAFSVVSVPEPGPLALGSVALACLVFLRRRS